MMDHQQHPMPGTRREAWMYQCADCPLVWIYFGSDPLTNYQISYTQVDAFARTMGWALSQAGWCCPACTATRKANNTYVLSSA